jgi:hypothetical protein
MAPIVRDSLGIRQPMKTSALTQTAAQAKRLASLVLSQFSATAT